jgi:hypothetical protein
MHLYGYIIDAKERLKPCISAEKNLVPSAKTVTGCMRKDITCMFRLCHKHRYTLLVVYMYMMQKERFTR